VGHGSTVGGGILVGSKAQKTLGVVASAYESLKVCWHFGV